MNEAHSEWERMEGDRKGGGYDGENEGKEHFVRMSTCCLVI